MNWAEPCFKPYEDDSAPVQAAEAAESAANAATVEISAHAELVLKARSIARPLEKSIAEVFVLLFRND